MEKAKYLFLCSSYPKKYDDFFRKLSGDDSTISGNIHSSSIISGLEDSNKDFLVISGVGIGHYPLNTKTKRVPSIKFSNNYYSVGYNNHVLVSQGSKKRAMIKCFKKHCSFKNEPLNILLADIHEPFARAALKIKKYNKNSKIINICLDVPDTIISTKEGFARRILKKISIKRNLRLLKKIDGFVLLSKEMEKRLPTDSKPTMISPFIADMNLYNGLKKNKTDKIKITYCGVLSVQYNIDLLLEAFKCVKGEQFELILVGKGDGVSLIKEYAKEDHRIKYLGELTRDEALQIQLDATVLVNPRLPEKHYTSFSFPSKTISYLLSKNPVVCYSFSSFPLDIKNMIFEPKSLSSEDFASAIVKASKEKTKADFSVLETYSKKTFVENLDKLFFNLREKNE